MSETRLGAVRPGRLGVFAGALSAQPADVQRRVAQELERLGYGTLWCGEALGREAFAQAALLLAATSRLVVGTGIANIYVRDATAMANAGRTLAEAWPGRFILGLGVSHRPLVETRGAAYSAPVTTMRRYLELMDAAPWRGPEAAPPPRVLAALGPRMAALAAERTAGAYPYFTTLEHVRAIRQAIGDEPFLAVDLPVVLAAGRDAARAIGDRHMRGYLRADNYRNNLLRLGWSEPDVEPPGSDGLFDAVVAWGSEAEVEAQVRARFAAGADQVVLNLVTADPGLPYVEELRRLAFLTGRE